ncbi:WD40-repeat-containing domain [Pseudocohnilembus persalinus]|uniref:WD40-repeat-containing domain n=1 Tax=Pseudocohnilembus persalinus TaxID=266149 RepID=A0A0V0QBI2_PSEPJ|nr:WD40-repeat-containing domain [Pseudocohnilembus persalinus]|eukprot:KRW99587.1 WD40-repeat-containing domain [Pseudocohnilembus persalinus]
MEVEDNNINNKQKILQDEEEIFEEENFKQDQFEDAIKLEIQNKDQQQALLRPYKSVGVFIDDNPFFVYNIANQSYILTSTDHSFKVYTLPQIKVQLLSPTFPNKIRILKMQVLGKYLIALGEGNILTIIEHNKNEIIHQINLKVKQIQGINQNQNQIFDFIHPPTYLNKILVVAPYSLQIYNIATKQRIYSFDKFLEEQIEKQNPIQCVVGSPVLDVVAISFANGSVYLFDIKADKILFKVMCQLPAISMAFSKQEPPLLACGDEKGNITIWELNERKKFSVLKEVHSGCVNSLHFQNDSQMLLSGSGQGNEIFQWKFEDLQDQKFILNRKRNGLKSNITKLRYMDKNHVLASTNNQKVELREFSLINEGLSQFYSVKQQAQKQMKNKNILTENVTDQNQPILDFSFSMNRARDWANVVTIHKDSDKPCLFNSEDKSIVKKNIQLFDTTIMSKADLEKTKNQNKEHSSEISTVYVTNCGNFGVLGFQNGKIAKFNLQSGKLQKIYRNQQNGHNSTITSIFVNFYNKYLVSTCQEGKLIVWDFFAATIINQIQQQDCTVTFMRPAKYADNFIAALTDCTLQVWDTQAFKIGRKFEGHTNKITDACWVQSNKQIISAGMDGLINIYDILSNQLIQSIKMKSDKYYVTSLDMYDDILITAFNNSRQVFMWHNLIDSLYWNTGDNKTKTIEFKSLLKYHTNTRQNFYLADRIKKEQEQFEKDREIELELDIGQDDDKDLIKFTQLESGKWLPLIYIDEIKERNTLENNEKEEIKLPFFLDFENKDKVKTELQIELKEKIQEKSRIIDEKKEKYLIELEQGLENLFVKTNKKEFIDPKLNQLSLKQKAKQFFEFLKQLNYTQVDYEMRRFLFGNYDNITILANIFNVLFDEKDEFDLKNTYFTNFIKISTYDIINNYELIPVLEEIKNKIKNLEQNIENKINYVSCLAQNFAKIPY